MLDLTSKEYNSIEEQIAVHDTVLNTILGISDLLFEVIYGANEGLHSKSNEVLSNMHEYFQSNPTNEVLMVIRCVYLKLFNEVDTEKQQPLYDFLVKNL